VKPGDVILGLPSNGLHTNGYSLARKIFFDKMGWEVYQRIESLGETLGAALLKPHLCYSNAILNVYRHLEIHALAHLTGGGFPGNIPRVLPQGCKAVIKKGSWKILPIFQLLQDCGGVLDEEMYQTFNMGIGMIVIIASRDVQKAKKLFKQQGFEAPIIGEIGKGKPSVEMID
jgi:phosphoribosylformylglycinamidine cyclo-ligase